MVLFSSIEALCREPHQTPQDVPVELPEWEKRQSQTAPESSIYPQQMDRPPGEICEGPILGGSSDNIWHQRHKVAMEGVARGAEREEGNGRGQTDGAGRKKKRRFLTRRKGRKKDFIKSAEFDRVGHGDYVESAFSTSSSDDDEVGGVNSTEGSKFRSLLLFIPLRLGQEKFNMEYRDAVKVERPCRGLTRMTPG